MNSKAIAAIMALAMVAVGFAVTAVDSDVDGETTTIDRVTVAVGDSKDTGSMGVNEGNYASYSYELKWTIKIGESAEQVLGTITQDRSETTQAIYYNGSTFSDTAGSSDLASIKLVMDTTVGVYHLNITGQDKAGEFGYTVEAALKVWVGDDKDTAKDFGVFATFNGTVVVTKTDNAIEVTIEEGKTFKVGTYTVANIKSTVTIANYDWYATNLPKGLAMGYDGVISGIPTVDNKIDDGTEDTTKDGQRTFTFQVYASDKKDGTILYAADVTITIQAQDEPSEMNFTYEVAVGDEGAAKASTYIASVKDTVTLTVKSAGTGGDSALQDVDVTIIRDSGVETEKTNVDGQINLPTTGTGAYIVTMTYDGQTQSFTVYVVGKAANITASIVIEGA